jgi:RNA polymerase sigma-70 factor (ECF subfamily)
MGVHSFITLSLTMQAPITDTQIIALLPACQCGDCAAIEGLYDLYADRLYRYLVARIGDPEVAADLTAELFVRVIKKVPGFRLNSSRPAASFSAWLYRIAANLAADYRRQQGRRREVSLDEQLSLLAKEPCPEHCAEQREVGRRLARAIETLSEDQRLVVIGKFGEEMSNLQIAEWLGKTEGAVKALQHRALRALGKVLGAEEV